MPTSSSTQHPAGAETSTTPSGRPGLLTSTRLRAVVAVVVGGALVAGVVLRFVTQSPLWLDEALSVNIAGLPIDEIGDALRRDGHPPLYYVLLHAWMAGFGEGDVAVRALSGVWGLALLPLLWVAGRRLGGPRTAWLAVGVVALSPYALRYATETRMYAMVMVLVLVGWLVLDDLLRRPTIGRIVGLAAVVAALLWTHYWSMWLLASVGIVLVVRWVVSRRSGDDDVRRAAGRSVLAIVLGGVAFLPWLPTLVYQGAHTGTPWARPVRPTELVAFTVADLGGGPSAESVVLGWFLGGLVVIGLLGRRRAGGGIEFDGRLRPEGRPFAYVIALTLGIATVVGYVAGATYASRYAAVFVPFVYLLAALGLSRLRPVFAAGALVVVVVLGAVGAYRNVTVDRSDAVRSAEAIEDRGADGDLVVYCPDQLGPSTDRVLSDRFEQLTYPELARPELVDWVDYTERLETADPAEFAAEVLTLAGDRRIFLVYFTGYVTHEDTCEAVYNAFGAVRAPEELTEPTGVWEPSAVVVFEAGA